MQQHRRRAARPGRSTWRWLVAAVVVLGLLGGAVFVGQRQLIYFPNRSAPPPAAEVIPGARDVTLATHDGLELTAWLVPARADAATGATGDTGDTGMAVLFLPGNGGNRTGRIQIAEHLSARGLTVLLMDYRGYGGNPGRPTEDGLAADALAAQERLVAEGFPPDRQVYLGESLGTGVASALAAARPPAALLLRSPFTELADVGRTHYPWLPVGLLLRDRYAVLAHVRELDVPVTVVRGTVDRVVPTRLSEQVARAAPYLVEELVFEGAGHNDPVMVGPEVADAVLRLIDAAAGR
ncbi:alpha/beta hydrolase [Ornithinimicrobium sufpigmenti]|uniref:alpha/beta hydrolase n=1 Tax=Ornithinimicrobium sufpigmenti TaxID=2508882 RepID=UPI0010358406|nr:MULTISPECIES: alpha/beta hydrolase [unclassified Ornithinimicrobium]